MKAYFSLFDILNNGISINESDMNFILKRTLSLDIRNSYINSKNIIQLFIDKLETCDYSQETIINFFTHKFYVNRIYDRKSYLSFVLRSKKITYESKKIICFDFIKRGLTFDKQKTLTTESSIVLLRDIYDNISDKDIIHDVIKKFDDKILFSHDNDNINILLEIIAKYFQYDYKFINELLERMTNIKIKDLGIVDYKLINKFLPKIFNMFDKQLSHEEERKYIIKMIQYFKPHLCSFEERQNVIKKIVQFKCFPTCLRQISQQLQECTDVPENKLLLKKINDGIFSFRMNLKLYRKRKRFLFRDVTIKNRFETRNKIVQ